MVDYTDLPHGYRGDTHQTKFLAGHASVDNGGWIVTGHWGLVQYNIMLYVQWSKVQYVCTLHYTTLCYSTVIFIHYSTVHYSTVQFFAVICT